MQPTGIRRKALCIGIQYKEHREVDEVTGAHTDARRLATFLEDRFGYEVEVMLDDKVGRYQPTKKNFYEAVQRLVKGAKAEDRLFFHFSGHGTQMDNTDNTERDGLDEVILPVDCKVNHDFPDEHNPNHWFQDSRIVDDELNDWFLPILPSGCRLTVLIDACHSGTAFDLKYTYSYSSLRQILPGSGLGCESSMNECFFGASTSPVKQRDIPGPTNERSQANNFSGNTTRVHKCSGIDRHCRSQALCRVTENQLQSHQEGPVVAYWAPCTDAMYAYGSANGGLMVNMFVEFLSHVSDELPTHRELLCSLHRRLRKKCHEIKHRNPKSLIELQEPQFGTNVAVVIDQPVFL